MRVVIFSLFISIIFSGCVLKEVKLESHSAKVIIRSPMVRIADFAFLSQTHNQIDIQIYNISKVQLSLSIGEQICINKFCYEKLEFNREFFKNEYDEHMLESIILGQPILGKHNFEQKDDGFIQHFNDKQIIYEVNKNNIIFKDKVVLIKIERQ